MDWFLQLGGLEPPDGWSDSSKYVDCFLQVGGFFPHLGRLVPVGAWNGFPIGQLTGVCVDWFHQMNGLIPHGGWTGSSM